MSGQFLIDWLALAISLFNTLILVWLGLTVLLNAERRNWGVFLAVAGLLAGAGFFLSHSIVLSQGASALIRDFSFWWHVGWVPLIAAPFVWYLLMLWYSGYWDDRASPLRRRQKVWLVVSVAFSVLLAGLLLVANPLPSISHESYVEVERLPSVGSIPLLLLVYPPYILMCIGLALDALLRPTPSGRVMGDKARQRARPWLTAASLVLFLVSLMVGVAILWLLQTARQRATIEDLILTLSTTLSVLDLLLAALLMASILLLGQAIISYEIFTGQTLPRRGFLYQWRIAVLFTAGLSLLAAWGVTAQIPQVYTALAILLLAAVSYTLFNWQSFRERQRSMRQMRPLAASQRLFDSMLTSAQNPHSDLDLAAPFSALCQDVLGARQAALIPLGPLAALGCTPLHHPGGAAFEYPALTGLLAGFGSPQMTGLPLDPAHFNGAIWAAPLWSERGLIGLLLLGEKSDGGFYSLEEIEIARSSGERLVDIQASAEMARRLMTLQRQRLVESQVLDRQTRRILHDDVLPRLHAILLEVSASPAPTDSTAQFVSALTETHRQISDLLHDLPRAAAPEVGHHGLFGALREVVGDELRGAFDQVSWQISAEAESCAQELPALAAEVLFYAAREALRNAARHARPADSQAPLCLEIRADGRDGLEISIQDNGVGLSEGRPGGSGQGLTLHSTMMAVMGGTLALESTPGVATRVVLRLAGVR
jgi:signal transduction histidine kinase